MRFLAIRAFLHAIFWTLFGGSIIASAFAQTENLRFERMWPTLHQPMYFGLFPRLSVHGDNVLILSNDRFQKFTVNGQFVTGWGASGSDNAEFDLPSGAALDSAGNFYITEAFNNRVQKFSPDGHFIQAWGTPGTGASQFNIPADVVIDKNDNVYVADLYNGRVQKFSQTGVYIASLGVGTLSHPTGLALDQEDNLLVTDLGLDRVVTFASDGKLTRSWGASGQGPGQFAGPIGIDVGKDGMIFVADAFNNNVQFFTSDGTFLASIGGEADTLTSNSDPLYQGNLTDGILDVAADADGYVYISVALEGFVVKLSPEATKLRGVYNVEEPEALPNHTIAAFWHSGGQAPGFFDEPQDVAIGPQGSVYVTDRYNHRVQKFSPNGEFIREWGRFGQDAGAFREPWGIAVDANGIVYVADAFNYRIQRFTADGDYLGSWGGKGDGPGKFNSPRGIYFDKEFGYLYVADPSVEPGEYDRVKLLNTADGSEILSFGKRGSGPGQFNGVIDVAMDSKRRVYVADNQNQRVQKFTPGGGYLGEWKSQSQSVGDAAGPRGLAIDASDNVYLAVIEDDRIEKYTSDGQFLEIIAPGGGAVGSVAEPAGMAFSSDGKLFIADAGNDRVQVLKSAVSAQNAKAIIVAGGGPFEGNVLWEATRYNANFASRVLQYQGYSKADLFVMSSNPDIDLDGNGLSDDIDATLSKANLRDAIQVWAADADHLLVYLVDHGGISTFRLSANEVLGSGELSTWLNAWQTVTGGKSKVVYDACESGTFIADLAAKDRTIITATAPGQAAYFVSQGILSFSNHFWTQVLNGESITDAFQLASGSTQDNFPSQTPLLDANGNGIANETADFEAIANLYIGRGTAIVGDRPLITKPMPDQNLADASELLLFVEDIVDKNPVSHVWAVVQPPDFAVASSTTPVRDLPSVTLTRVADNRWQALYKGFDTHGVYQVTFHALDIIGNTSIPKTISVTVGNPLSRRAIIVAGGNETEASWTAIESNAQAAYQALKQQGYLDEDMYFMSRTTTTGVDVLTNLANLEFALSTWASDGAKDVSLYIAAPGTVDGFALGSGETLGATELQTRLDALQASLPGTLTVILEGAYTGGLIASLQAPADKQRIVISSGGASQGAEFLNNGELTFSKFFWSQVANGASVRAAFSHARKAVHFSATSQTPQMDDNGNGISNEKTDGKLAREYYLGNGVLLAGDEPLIGKVVEPFSLSGDASGEIWVEDVTTTGEIAKVWAVITPPNYRQGPNATNSPVVVELAFQNNGRYAHDYAGFAPYLGIYEIAIYAQDTQGNLSLPLSTKVTQAVGNDIFEPDDDVTRAGIVDVGGAGMVRNLGSADDVDWVQFHALAGKPYEIVAQDVGANLDIVLRLYDTDAKTVLHTEDAGFEGEEEFFSWNAPADGVYYLRISHGADSKEGPLTGYTLRVFVPIGPFPSFISGLVFDAVTGLPVYKARIRTSGNASALSREDGSFDISDNPGIYDLTVTAEGYAQFVITVEMNELLTSHVTAKLATQSQGPVPVVMTLEEPGAGAVKSGIANLRGWVVSLNPIDRLEYYINGVLKGNVPVGGRRKDVGNQYPDYPDSDKAGFSMAYSYNNLSPGSHTIEIRAYDTVGAEPDASASSTFSVVRFDTPFIADPALVSLAQSSVLNDEAHVFVQNVMADGKFYNVTLSWNTATQGFESVQIAAQNPLGTIPRRVLSSSAIPDDTYEFAESPGDVVLVLEEPGAGDIKSGISNLRGWVVARAAVNRVEYAVNGVLKGNIPVGGRRKDVGNQYPDYPNSDNAGYSMAFNYNNLGTGNHEIRVTAYDVNAVQREAIANFSVARFDTPFISDASRVDMSKATVTNDAGHIYINNITADGKSYNVTLEWSTPTQSFDVTSVSLIQ